MDFNFSGISGVKTYEENEGDLEKILKLPCSAIWTQFATIATKMVQSKPGQDDRARNNRRMIFSLENMKKA